MPSPTLTPSLLSTLGSSAPAPGAMLAVQQARESLPGAFARELHKLQAQAPTVSPPLPLQPPAPPPAQPPARATSGAATGPGTGPGTSSAGSPGARESGAPTPPGTTDDAPPETGQTGRDGTTRPTDPALDRQRQRLRASQTDTDASGARARTARSDAGGDGPTGRADRADPLERAARRRSSDADAAGDPSAPTTNTTTAQPAPVLPPAGQPLPARSTLPGSADPALQGAPADAGTAGSDPTAMGAPGAPGIDGLSGRTQTLAPDAGELSGSAPATPRPPHRPAAAGDTVASLAADGMGGSGARASGAWASSELQAVMAGRQDNAQAVLQAGTTGPQPALPSFAAELARASGTQMAGASAASAPPPAELTLPTPVTAPDFQPRLGGELALLARDGVQEARINVHPAELGPISVQIALDGTAAQVHLAVENAQTRELLEQAMPTLAAALRDTGLTLTGGGVFQQSRQAPQDQPAADARSRPLGQAHGDDGDGDADPARLAATTSRRLRPLGALDVFA